MASWIHMEIFRSSLMSIMISSYPAFDESLVFDEEEKKMEILITTIRSIRNRRAEMNVPPSRKAALHIVSARTDVFNEKTAKFFTKMASASEVTVTGFYHDDSAVQIVTPDATVYVPLAELIDLDKELERLNSEKAKTLGEIERLDKKLSNPGFVAKAPEAVVAGEKEKLEKYKDALEKIEQAIKKIAD